MLASQWLDNNLQVEYNELQYVPVAPTFIPTMDISSIHREYARKGLVFTKECIEALFLSLSQKLASSNPETQSTTTLA